ncbi:hypothetical protein SAMN02910327_00961 [Peptostreptococcaceae bacterium pGA-8]|nr:hypothetical protein SAMN02910327_00961 [Peptostreptococcaceae bacterium pGA-8]
MKYLFCLLIPIGISLLILSIKYVIRLVNAEIVYEMPCTDNEGAFTIKGDGRYGPWISGKLFTKSPIGEFGFKVINQHTGKEIQLSSILLRSKVNGFKTGRMELYSFRAEKGTYIISLNGEASARDKTGASVRNSINRQFVDYNSYSVQIRNHISGYVLMLCIFGIIFASMATLAGIIIPIVL